ncbi:anhydro-N-acetylmuramic acid kinase [Cryobacterium sp. MLB-32]|uniref:anhydro-N-acetylmuramic acid kinase n=1 Tax=Cryobacterium sp. MLB-32 TaxID=1529318 RepID=UPI00068C1FB3|nr:anhydro-N-acetylmuramic acid kinase [Cryobacterium sp. MLB-32]
MRILSLQSGTSVDGIDAVIVDIDADDDSPTPSLTLMPLYSGTSDWPSTLRSRIFALADGSPADARELCALNTLVGQQFARAAAEALTAAGTPVDLVVSHGQTVYHWVDAGHARGTLQLGEASWIAEAAEAPVLCNLRAADVAAGGEGAPLMGVFDRAWLCGAESADSGSATLNLGGIANLSVVADGRVRAWDTGPGNALIDAAIVRATASTTHEDYDRNGYRAAAGRVEERVLAALLEHPFLARRAPKSTGRETFDLAFVDAAADRLGCRLALNDLVATLTRFTARTIANSLAAETHTRPTRVIASGGGVHNPVLMTELRRELDRLGIALESSAQHGIDPDFKESLMFALLAFLTWHGIPLELPGTKPGRARLAGQLAFAPGGLGDVGGRALAGIRSLRVLAAAGGASRPSTAGTHAAPGAATRTAAPAMPPAHRSAGIS